MRLMGQNQTRPLPRLLKQWAEVRHALHCLEVSHKEHLREPKTSGHSSWQGVCVSRHQVPRSELGPSRTSAALTGVEEGVAVQPVGSCGVETLLPNSKQVILVQAFHVGRHLVHPSLQARVKAR